MKILFVGNTSWSMWNFRSQVMQYFKSKGYEIVVVAPEDFGVDLLKEKFTFEPIFSLSRKGLNPFRDILLTIELYRIYKRHNPDHIFQYTIKPNLYGSVAAFLCGKKPYSMVAGMGYVFTNTSVLAIVVSFMYRIAAMLSKGVLFLNREDIKDFHRFFILSKTSPKAILLPGEGVDTGYFSLRNENKIVKTRDHFKFLFVGRLLIDKGIREFLKAAKVIKKRFPNVHFQVIGPIDNGNPMSLSIGELLSYVDDGSVEYAGSVQDVRPFFYQADALILPTIYGEGLSRVCLESLSMGVPVISTNNRGCTSLIKDGVTGLIVEENKLDELPLVIERFISLSCEEREFMRLNCRELVVTHFDIDSVIKFYENLISIK